MTKENNPEKDVFTEVEIQTLTKAIEETEQWLKEERGEQKSLKNHEPVKLTIKLLSEKMHNLDREVKYLVNKLKIWRPKKVEPKPEESENTTESKDSPAEETIETEQEPDVLIGDIPETQEPANETLQLEASQDEHAEL